MKSFLHRILVLSAVAFAVLSCGKEDILDDGGERFSLSEAEEEEYDIISMLMSALCGTTFDLEDVVGLKGKTFEPVYGDVYDESASFERTVLVYDSSTAESYFCGLVGWSESCLEETAGGYSVSFPVTGFGSMEFFREGDGNNMGYALVNIPSIPHLQKIIYKTKEQLGENAVSYFESPCLYGEVYLHEGRYYICVKESSGYTDSAQGYLVCMESGKGSYWQDYCSEKWGCWKPKDKWRDARCLYESPGGQE